jgi:dihydrofolate reductase
MNKAPKWLVSKTLTDVAAWNNSNVIEGELDVIVIGSTSVVHTLMEHDIVDEFRLLVFPTVLGAGRRLFTDPLDLSLVSVEQSGAAALLRYESAAAAETSRT